MLDKQKYKGKPKGVLRDWWEWILERPGENRINLTCISPYNILADQSQEDDQVQSPIQRKTPYMTTTFPQLLIEDN